MSSEPTMQTNELMRRQYTRLNEAMALARAEVLPHDKTKTQEEQWETLRLNGITYAKLDALMTAQEIITQTWKEYLGC